MSKPSPDELPSIGHENGAKSVNDSDDTPKNHEDDDETTSAKSSTQPTKAAAQPLPPLSKLLRLARPEWSVIFFAFLLMIAAESTGLLNPLLLSHAYDSLVNPTLTSHERMSDISHTMMIVLLVHGGGLLIGFIRTSLMNAAGERVVARLRTNLYQALLKQEIAFFDEHKTGELVSRLTSDTSLLQVGTSQALPEVVLGVVKLVVSIGLMFWISARLASLTVGFVFVIFMICVPLGRLLGTLSKAYQDVLGQAQTYSTEALGAMRTVQSFAAEKRENERYRKAIGEPDEYPFWWPSPRLRRRRKPSNFVPVSQQSDAPTQQTSTSSIISSIDNNNSKTTYSVGFSRSLVQSAFMSIIFGVGFGGMYLSLWYGFKLVNDGVITLGKLTAFQSYIFQIGAGLGTTSRFLSQLIEAQGASGRIFYLLERVPTIPIPPPPPENAAQDKTKKDNHRDGSANGGGDEESPVKPEVVPYIPLDPLIKPETMEGLVEFRDVSFAYPSRPDVPVLENFSLTIPVNSTCALVGSSGAGKSTVVALLQRFYDITSGSVCVDGNDIRNLDVQWLRSHMAYVQQEPQLFGLTVRQNICYGVDRPVTQAEVEAVSRKANAHDFIVQWPQGYDTMVGERGVKLSGGQKQRIAIARALLVDPRILLLDEATSALDAESEHLVQQAIENAVVGRTVVVVAHRLSTIKHSRQIVVVNDHRIIDQGTHDELLQRCSKYQDLIKRQAVFGGVAEAETTTIDVDAL